MDTIQCINCGKEIKLDISSALDENGEVFKCPNCGQIFRYTNK